MGDIRQEDAQAYDNTRLIESYVRARRAADARESVGGAGPAAQSLCEFFDVLMADETFWRIATSFEGEPPPLVTGVMESLEEFEELEERLLVMTGIAPDIAANLVVDVSSHLRRPDFGSTFDIAGLRAGVEDIRRRICESTADFDRPERTDRRWRRFFRGLTIAGGALVASANVVVPPPGNLLSFGGGLALMTAQIGEAVRGDA